MQPNEVGYFRLNPKDQNPANYYELVYSLPKTLILTPSKLLVKFFLQRYHAVAELIQAYFLFSSQLSFFSQPKPPTFLFNVLKIDRYTVDPIFRENPK